MGITGLIPFLEKATRKITLKDLKGSTVGIDTYCWLHKGAISCADKLLRGDPTDLHIKFCLKNVNLLLSYGIKPVLVFDGRHLPAKALTEKRRGASRKEAKELAKKLLREGKVNEARQYINRSVNITHEMAHQLIVACRKLNVDCIVAPYEADGQLGYLSRQRIIDYVITEDSDLTLFGCHRVIFKFDLTGQGLLFDGDLLHEAMGCKKDKFEFRRFEMMAILSGCDYLDSLRGVGLAKACKFVLMTEERDVRRCLRKLPQYLNLKGITVEDEYVDGFLRALYTFRHMIVYDPRSRRQVHLTEPEEDDLPYCDNAGEKMLDEDLAFQLAIGNVNPFTLKQIDHWHPSELNTAKYPSIWGDVGSHRPAKPHVIRTTVIQTTPKKATPTSKRKFLRPEVGDEEEAGNTSMDIMNMYLEEPIRDQRHEVMVQHASPPPEAKKPRLSQPTSDRKDKNPFLKKTAPDAEQEARKPVVSLLQQANAIKVEGAANQKTKFRRTTLEMDKKKNFVSRFFSPTSDKPKQDRQQEDVAVDEGIIDDTGPSVLSQTPVKDAELDAGSPTVASSNSQRSEVSAATEIDIDCSALCEADYSGSESSQKQRENEQSPVPWLNAESASQQPVLDTELISSQNSDKENELGSAAAPVDSNKQPLLDTIVIDSADDTTPVKVKPAVRTQLLKGQKQKKAMPSTSAKQKTLMSFFKKK